MVELFSRISSNVSRQPDRHAKNNMVDTATTDSFDPAWPPGTISIEGKYCAEQQGARVLRADCRLQISIGQQKERLFYNQVRPWTLTTHL